MQIETERLRLRDGTAADIEGLCLGLNDPAIAGWLVRPPFPYRPADAEAFLRLTRTAAAGGFRPYRIVAERASDRLVGVVSLEPDRARAELGYWLLTSAQGRGYVAEAAEALIAAGAAALPEVEVAFATVRPGNARSLAVLRKLGFARVEGDRSLAAKGGRAGSWLFERALR